MNFIKKLVIPSESRSSEARQKLGLLFSLVVPQANDYRIVYGNYQTETASITKRTFTYYNYAVGYQPGTLQIAVVGIDAALREASSPLYFNPANLKKAGKGFSQAYYFENLAGDSVYFRVPPFTLRFGSASQFQPPIFQEEEEKLFKAFFKTNFGKEEKLFKAFFKTNFGKKK
ncbi:hypothetical protein [Deminuibacter soli]|nr:hypothetical protein [Deminuibacter soli]